MIDFHTHILPEIDDGSDSTETSFAMFEQMEEQGVRNVIATPHFYANTYTVDQFIQKRAESYQKIVLQAEYRGIELPKIRLGAEVLYFNGISRANLLNKLCIEDTNVLLLELPYSQWEQNIYDELCEVLQRKDLRIVLAHIERYYPLQKDKTIWDEVMQLPFYKQMNAGAFVNWKKRHQTLKILKEQGDVVFGSDCHNDTTRKPNLLDGLSIVVEKMGDGYLKRLSALEEALMGKW